MTYGEPLRSFGPYRIAERMAVGGMAEVFRALLPQGAGAERSVVIKRLLPELQRDAVQRAMFEREAELGSYIRHPNVVEVLGYGEVGGAPYLALEYVFGVDLWKLQRCLARRDQRLDDAIAIYVACEMLLGLEAVHAARDAQGVPLYVVHRDVSPSNVYLSVHGEVKLGDLGIARTGPWAEQKSERAKGKLSYLPPEQVAGRPVDQRSDVFSAAVVLAELLMGRPLFARETEIAVLLAIRDGDVEPVQSILPRLPEGLGDVLLAALSAKPERRTRTAAELRAGLMPYLPGQTRVIREKLGRLVMSAMDDSGEAVDRISLAETLETDVVSFAHRTLSTVRERGPAESQYVVHAAQGKLGPWPLSRLVMALATEEVGAEDRVQVDGAKPTAVARIAALAPYLPGSKRTPSLRQRTRLGATTEIFNLELHEGMLSVLAHLLLDRAHGLLVCERPGVRKEVYLELGRPVVVGSNQRDDLLGEQMVQEGLLTRVDLELALEVLPRYAGRLGETIVALGLVDPIRLVQFMTAQVAERLSELFDWRAGRAALYRGVPRPERAFALDVDGWELLERGAERRIAGGNATSLPAERQALELVGRLRDGLDWPAELRALRAQVAKAPMSLADVRSELGHRAPALVLLLVSLGALRPCGPPTD